MPRFDKEKGIVELRAFNSKTKKLGADTWCSPNA